MYEINLSTLLLIGLDDMSTKVITLDEEFIVPENTKNIINNSCKFFGSTLIDRVNMTKRLTKIANKAPIIVEESRNIIFFPLKSTREKCNIWISFNNLKSYVKHANGTVFKFNNNKDVFLDFSYYIIDNQVTRSMILDYVLKNKKDCLKI